MAITNEQMNIYLGVDATVASKELKNISTELQKTNSSMRNLQGTSDDLNTNLVTLSATQELLGTQMFSNNLESQSLSKATIEMSKAYQKVAEEAEKVFSTQEGRADVARKSLEVLKVSAIGMGAAFSGLALINLFTGVAKDSDILKSSISSLGGSFNNLAQNLSSGNVAQSMGEFGKSSSNILQNLGLLAVTSSNLFKNAIGSSFSDVKRMATGLVSTFSHMREEWLKTGVEFAAWGPAIASVFGIVEESIGESEGALGGFAKELSDFGGVATIAFTLAMRAIAEAVSDTLLKIGGYMLGFVTDFESHWAEAEQATKSFEFTLKGFQNTFGELMIGTSGEWSRLMAQIAESTTFSVQEIQKASQLVVAENTAIGLSFNENSKFIQRAAEIATNKSMSLTDVIMRLQAGLLGSSQAVGILAINLGTHALEHSDLNKEIKKTVGTMTEMEKQQIRLAEIFRQTEPIVGSITNAQDNYLTVNKKLSVAIDVLKIKLGTINGLIVKGKSLWADFVKSIANLPTIFFEISGAGLEVAGIIFTLTGYFISAVFGVTSLAVAYGFLNKQMATNIKLQTFLNLAFESSPIKAAVVPVKSLADVMKNLGIVFKSLLATIGLGIIPMIGTALGKIAHFGILLLKNPLFYAASGVVAGLIIVLKALQEMNQEFDFLNKLANEFTGTSKGFAGAMASIGDGIGSAFTAALSIVKIITISLFEMFQLLRLIGIGFGKAFGADDSEDMKKVDIISDQLDSMGAAHSRYVDTLVASLSNIFDKVSLGQAFGADEATRKIKDLAKEAEELAFKTDQLNTAFKEVDVEEINISILGSDVDKLKFSFQKATDEIEKFKKEIFESESVSQQALDGIKKAYAELVEAGTKLTKMQNDNIKGIEDITKEVSKSILKSNQDQTLEIIAGFEERTEAVKKFEISLGKLGPISTEAATKIKAAYGAIATAQKAALEAEKRKREEEGSAETIRVLREQAQALKDIQDKNLEIEKFNKGDALTTRQKIASDLQLELALIKDRLDLEKATWGETSKVSEELAKQKVLLEQQAKIQTEKAPSAEYENIAKIGTNIGEKITKSFTDGFSGMVAGSASVVASMGTAISGIVDAINSLLDFIPNLLNSVAGIFNKITDFPKVLFEAFQGLFDSILRMVSDFIPNLIASVFQAVTQLKDFANNLANSLDGLVESLPDLISNLMEKLPDIAVSLAENLGKAWLKIMNAIMIKLPIALVKGFLMGLQKIFEGVKRLLSGKSFLPKVKLDTTEVAKNFKNLAGTAGRLFSVKDLAESVKDPLDEMTKGIEDAFKRGTDWIKQAWMWVYEKILLPLWDMVVGAWTWVRDKILMPVWNALTFIVKGAFAFVQALWDALGTVVKAAWIIVQQLWDTLITVVSSAWQFVKDLWDGLKTVVSGAFQWVIDKVINPLMSVGEAIAKPIREAFDGIADFFSGIGQTFANLFDFKGATAAFQNAGTAVAKALGDTIKAPFNAIIDIFNGLKMGPVGWSVSAGKLGSWSGELFPEIDLIPGDIQRFAKGGFVEGIAAQSLTKDNVPAMLTPGEFVMSRRGVNTAGPGMLQSINSGQMPSAGNTYNIQFEINVEAKQTMDEGFIRQQLIPKMRENLKRASLDGEFVLSSKGVRS